MPEEIGQTTIPWGYDIAWLLLVAVLIAIAVLVFVKERKQSGWPLAVLWTSIVVLIPVLGLLAWIIYRVLSKSTQARDLNR